MSDSLLYKYVNICTLKHILGGSIRMTYRRQHARRHVRDS
ncbi:hypothetical protein bAD24_I10820 [Burkholderia sp. AD24]|nr:hypothetical protein bAD24_I10820 [Burkholderia sp. AD24]